jgi:uncharacterized membrane protein YkvI
MNNKDFTLIKYGVKFFYAICSVTFISVGSVIGAGFISGRELVSFFGTGNFLPRLIFASVLLSAFFSLLFLIGRNFTNLNALNQKLFKSEKIVSVAILTASFISVSTLLAGVDSLVLSAFNFSFPICSIVLIIAVSLFSKGGIKGVEKLSVTLMPIVVIVATFMIIKKGDLGYSKTSSAGGVGVVSAILYASMNAFINLPPIVECSSGKKKSVLIVSAILSGVLLFIEGYLILNTVVKSGTFDQDIPLLSAIGNAGGTLFFIALFSSMVTSVFSAYYPLYFFAKDKGKKYGVGILAVALFCFSRLGIKNLVGHVYPIIGAFGVVYLISCVKYLIRKKYKKIPIDDNKIEGENYEQKKEK